MFNNPMGAGQKAGENIEEQFRGKLIDVRKRAEGYLPSGILKFRVSVKWLYLLEGIRISWHREIATNPSYTPSVVTILLMIILVIRRRTMSRPLEHDRMIISAYASGM